MGRPVVGMAVASATYSLSGYLKAKGISNVGVQRVERVHEQSIAPNESNHAGGENSCPERAYT